VLAMTVAEMDFPLAPPVSAVLREALERSDVGYLAKVPSAALATRERGRQLETGRAESAANAPVEGGDRGVTGDSGRQGGRADQRLGVVDGAEKQFAVLCGKAFESPDRLAVVGVGAVERGVRSGAARWTTIRSAPSASITTSSPGRNPAASRLSTGRVT